MLLYHHQWHIVFFVIAICRRKLEMQLEDVIRAVNALDLKTFSLENVEILQRMLPTETEVSGFTNKKYLVRDNLTVNKNKCCYEFQAKAYRDYAISKKNIDLLTEEDRFIYRLSHTERLATKLQVMCYMGNFFDNVYLITPVRAKFVLGLKGDLFTLWLNSLWLITSICSKFKLFCRHPVH